MAVGLDKVAEQRDFSAGMWRSVREDLVPRNGVVDAYNYLLDNAGSLYKRGGTTYRTSQLLGSATWLPFIWDGFLTGGVQRTVIASTGQFGRVNADGTVTALGGSGMAIPGRAAVFQGVLYFPGGATYNGTVIGTSPKIADFYAVAGNRLFAATGDTIAFSDIGAGGVSTTTFAANDYHQVPEGVQTIGLEGLRNALVAFTTGGVWVYSNIGYDLTDSAGNVQQRVDRYSRDLILWGNAGIAAWEGGLVVPGLDDVWVMQLGVASEAPSPFQRVSKSISRLYREYVARGYSPGQACVYRAHYYLPILNGTSVVDMLVCRLDMAGGDPEARPWTHLGDFGAQTPALTVRTSASSPRQPEFIGTDGNLGKVLNLAHLDPKLSVARDANGSAPRYSVQFADLPTGPLNKNTIVKVRIGYELGEMPADSVTTPVDTFWGLFDWGGADWGTTPEDLAFQGEPELTLTELQGSAPPGQPEWGLFDWGQAEWGLTSGAETFADTAPPDEFGLNPKTWNMAKIRRFARFRLDGRNATSHSALNWLEIYVRSNGRR